MVDEELEEKEELEEAEEKPVQEKIGFYSAPSNPGDNSSPAYKKKIKFSNQRKTGLQRATFGFFVASTIVSIAALAFFLMPVLSALAGIVAFLIIGMIILVPILATAFIILVSEEYRQFVGRAWKVVEWFFDATNHIAELSPYYIYVGIPALVLEVITIILCITTLVKGQKGVVTYLIVTSILFLVILVFTIIYFANGMMVFKVN